MKNAGILIFFIFLLTGCAITTPEIRGVVLDAETKEPVKARINEYVGLTTKTVAGDVGNALLLQQPHLRSDENGKFIIASRRIKKPPFPLGFGTEVDAFSISATDIVSKSGEIKLSPNELGKKSIEVTIYIEDDEKIYQRKWQTLSPEKFERTKEEFEFSKLQGFFRYCISGRFGIEVYIAESPKACDEWELERVITRHERYLDKYPSTDEYRSSRTIIFEQLGLLYEKSGDYEKALVNLKKARQIRFFRPQDVDHEIERVQELLKNKQR